MTNGKIKGLFCCLPLEQFYSFSVFGLYAQSVPFKAATNLSQMAGELFSTAWFHTEPPSHHGGGDGGADDGVVVGGNKRGKHNGNSKVAVSAEVAHALQVAGTASKLAVQRNSGANNTTSNSSGSNSKSSNNNNKPHLFRFSRYSSISNLQAMSGAALEGGVFLALCRVLVVQQLTVTAHSGPIEEQDIMTGLQQGCDCVYSPATLVSLSLYILLLRQLTYIHS